MLFATFLAGCGGGGGGAKSSTSLVPGGGGSGAIAPFVESTLAPTPIQPASVMTAGSTDHRQQMYAQAASAAAAAGETSQSRSAGIRGAQSLYYNFTYVAANATQAVVAPDGSIWALSTMPSGPNKYIWHYVNGQWINIPGQGSRLAVGDQSSGTYSLFLLTSAGALYWAQPTVNSTSVVTFSSNAGGYYSDVASYKDATSGVCTSYTGGCFYAVALSSNANSPIYAGYEYYLNTPTVESGLGEHVASAPDSSALYVTTSAGAVYRSAITTFPSVPTYTTCGGQAAVDVAPMQFGNGYYLLNYTSTPASGSLVSSYTYAQAKNCASGTTSATNGFGVSVSYYGSLLTVVGTDGGIYSAITSGPPAVSTSATTPGSESVYINGSATVEQQIASNGQPGYSVSLPGSVVSDFRGVSYTGSNYGASGELYMCVEGNFYPGQFNPTPRAISTSGTDPGFSAIATDMGPDGTPWQIGYLSNTPTVLINPIGYGAFPTNFTNQDAMVSLSNPNPLSGFQVIPLSTFFGTSVNSMALFTVNLSRYSDNVYLGGVYQPNGTSLVQTYSQGTATQISGLNTQLSSPAGMAAAPDGTLYVANSASGTITAYAPGASGNVAPIRVITGFTNFPTSFAPMAVDSYGNLYVSYGGSIYQFPSSANGPYSAIGTSFGSGSSVTSIEIGPASQGGTFRAIPQVANTSIGVPTLFSVAGTPCTDQVEAYSSNSAVAAVYDSNMNTGVTQARAFWIDPLASGSAIITVYTSSGKTATMTVNVGTSRPSAILRQPS